MENAYILINCDFGSEEKIIEDLKHLTSVSEIHGTFGAYDIIVKLENSEKDRLRETIARSIRSLEHVRSALTLMGVPGQN